VSTTTTFSSFHDAYLAILREVRSRPLNVIDARGRWSREIPNVSFVLTNPVERIPFLESRRPDIALCVAASLGMLESRNDTAVINHYHPGRNASTNITSSREDAAYIIQLGSLDPGTNSNSVEAIIAMMADDPRTEAAIIPIIGPDTPGRIPSRAADHPSSIQFLHRDDRLHCVVQIHTEDAYVQLPRSVFSCTLIQEYVARRLGVAVGAYRHHVDSLHVQERDTYHLAEAIREVTRWGYTPPAFTLPAMPTDARNGLATALLWEHQLRTNQRATAPSDPELRGIDPYWRNIILLLEIDRQVKIHQNRIFDAGVFQALHPAYRWLVAHDWPARLPPYLR